MYDVYAYYDGIQFYVVVSGPTSRGDETKGFVPPEEV